jgi:glucose-6-phosphate dehydrogenase assembly protein OpcA
MEDPMSRLTVPLRDVERELNRQTKVLQGPGSSTPVLRARMANLVIFCNGEELAAAIDQDIPDVCAAHPARVLLLIGDRNAPENPVTAEVFVRPVNVELRRFACAEQVTLHAGGGGVDRLPFAVRAVMIGDLPMNLWWAAPVPPPLAGPLMYELGEHAQQIVYDSIGWPDPARGVAATASWLEQVERRDGAHWRVASDLNWRRLKYWRRLLKQALDPGSAPGAAESTTEVLVEHGPHAVVMAWLLMSWLSRRLGWKVLGGKVTPGVEMVWRCDTSAGPARIRIRRLEQGPPEVRRVRVACKLNDVPGALNLLVEDGQRLAIHLEGVDAADRTLSLPRTSPAELIGRQLSDRERDPVFHESMAIAQVMARSLLA